MLNWRMRIVWGGPKDYYIPRWLFDWGWYGFTGYVRVLGLLIQVYDKRSIIFQDTPEQAAKMEATSRSLRLACPECGGEDQVFHCPTCDGSGKAPPA